MELASKPLIAGIVGSFFAFILVSITIVYVVYCIIKKNANRDTDLSQASSMNPTISGNKLLVFVMIAFIFFLLPPISFIFIKSNVVLGDNYNPIDSCKIGWFLEYFCYETGKLMIAMFLIYRIYTQFNNSMYHIPKNHIMHIFFKFFPFLFLMYLILILLAFLLDDQFGILTVNTFLYCGFDNVSGVFVFGHIISFIREIGFNSIILYWFISRLYDMNKNAKIIKYEGHYTAKKIKKMEKQKENNEYIDINTKAQEDKQECEENTQTEVIKKKQKVKFTTINVENLSKKDMIWNGHIIEFGMEPQSTSQLQQWAKSKKMGDNYQNFTFKQAKDMFNQYKGKGMIGEQEEEDDDEEEEEKEEQEEVLVESEDKKVIVDIDHVEEVEEDEEEMKMKKKILSKDSIFNMQNRRGLIIKYVILIIIMFSSSFICQILLCLRKYPSFYISWDIIIQCVSCILLLWFNKPIWAKIIQIFHKICLCNLCCPVLIKQTLQI